MPKIEPNHGILFGNLQSRNCKLHGGMATRFGSLVDPNGHVWLICSDCIDNFWAGNQAFITEERVEERARQLLQERLLGGSGE
jgi:hypothetical protein